MENVKIIGEEKNGLRLTFIYDVSTEQEAVKLRREMIAVPIYAINCVIFAKNTSSVQKEGIALLLGGCVIDNTRIVEKLEKIHGYLDVPEVKETTKINASQIISDSFSGGKALLPTMLPILIKGQALQFEVVIDKRSSRLGINPNKYSSVHTCMYDDYEKGGYKFIVESTGALPCRDILQKALEQME